MTNLTYEPQPYRGHKIYNFGRPLLYTCTFKNCRQEEEKKYCNFTTL